MGREEILERVMSLFFFLKNFKLNYTNNPSNIMF